MASHIRPTFNEQADALLPSLNIPENVDKDAVKKWLVQAMIDRSTLSRVEANRCEVVKSGNTWDFRLK